MFRRSTILLLLLAMLMKYSTAITYRCDDDQIIVIQSFGNDTIRMHCQKPILCGLRFLKCHYSHLQSHCGGKTNFVAHLQQLTPISPVMHTCCNLTINEDIQITAHTGNDCFLYDIPDGSNGTTAEDLEKEDKDGYMLLKNVNKLPEKFTDFSGYRLRYYLLRKKASAEFVVKGVERNKIGYRITICSMQCQNSTEKLKQIIYDDDDKHIDLNKKAHAISDDNLNQIKIALRNLTDDGEWMIATWAEWTYKQWSQWSILHKIEINELHGTKGRDRYRIHKADTEIKTATETGQGKNNKMFTGKSGKGHHRMREGSRNCNDYENYSTERDKSNVAKEEQKLKVESKDCDEYEDYPTTKMDKNNVTKEEQKLKVESKDCDEYEDYPTTKMDKNNVTKEEQKLKVESKDCDEYEDYRTTKMDKNNVAKEEQKLKKHSEEVASSESKKELIIKLSEKQNCSELDASENLKSESKSHETNETKKETNLLATSITQAEEIEDQTKDSAKKTGSDDEGNVKIQRSRRPCDILIAIKIGNCDGDVDVVNTTIMTKSKEEDISKIKHKDISFPISSRLHSSGKQLLEEKKSDKKEKDVEERRAESSSAAKSKMYSEKSSTNEMITITREKSISQEIGKETISKQKISDKKSESQERKRKQQKKKAKDKSKQSSELEDRNQSSSVANIRKSKIVHDPVQAVLAAAKDPKAKARLGVPAMNCFSADTKVYTQNGEKTMKDVVVGDFVLVPVSKNQLRYERVEMFYHREPDTRAKFVTLETESGRNLKLTELHLLPLGDCEQMRESKIDADSIDQWLRKSKFAYKARVGDCVFTMTANHELQVDRIVKVGRQYLKGIYSPMTVEGSIVVSGVLASCFSQVENHFTQKLVYDFLVFLNRMFGWFMQSLDEPIQHLPTFIHSIHHLGRFAVPFVKY